MDPNFFIIGAPKCGTTAMSEYLRTHPNVFMSDPKEPAFFSEDGGPTQPQTISEYLALFAGATPEQVVVAEASTSYVHSEFAVERIREFRPDAKLLVMLRRPTDLVYAYHAEMLRLRIVNDDEWDFENAWARQNEGRVSSACGNSTYKRVGSLGSQVERVLQLFPREQVHFILFDDVVRDVRTEYQRLLEFLGIPDDGKTEFPKLNENIQFKSSRLTRLPRYIRAKVGVDRIQAIKKALGISQLGFVSAVDKMNSEARPRPPLRPEFRSYLDEVFDPEVVLLERLIGRDLSNWRTCATREMQARC